MKLFSEENDKVLKFKNKKELVSWIHSLFQCSEETKIFFNCTKRGSVFEIGYQFSCSTKKQMEKFIGTKDNYLIIDRKKTEIVCFLQDRNLEEEFSVLPDGTSTHNWLNDFSQQINYSEDELNQSLQELRKVG